MILNEVTIKLKLTERNSTTFYYLNKKYKVQSLYYLKVMKLKVWNRHVGNVLYFWERGNMKFEKEAKE